MRLCQKHWHNLVNTITIDYLNVYKFQHRSFYMFLRMCTYIHSKHFARSVASTFTTSTTSSITSCTTTVLTSHGRFSGFCKYGITC